MKIWRRRRKRIGVYVDAFNVYYGARSLCGRGTPGWRWLDLLALSETLAALHFRHGGLVEKLEYCTALRDKDGDPSSASDQNIYVNALQVDSRVHVEFGQYNVKTGKGVLVTPTSNRKRRYARVESPGLAALPNWLHAEEVRGPEGEENLLISYSSFEEKGSDVNLATLLIRDVLSGNIDAAIVLSNDGDLRLPLHLARQHVPVGLVNPTQRPLSQMLMGSRDEGVGGHWWARLSADELTRHQLPHNVNGFIRPTGW